MDKLSRLSVEDRENLVAYLDGELDQTSSRRIESILASSAAARHDVESLTRSYELLDLLPHPTVGADFTERTVSIAKLEGIRTSHTQRLWLQIVGKCLVLLFWTTAMVGSAALGAAAMARLVPSEAAQLLDQLPFLQQLDVYTEVDNLEFLQELVQQRQLLEEIQEGTRE